MTEQVPKVLLPAGGKPFADYQLKWLARNGVTEVVYSIGYKGEMVRDFAGDGSRWGLKIQYADEGRELRGTAGALRLCLDQGLLGKDSSRERAFFVLYGDSFLPVDFREVWTSFEKIGLPALMTVYRNEGRWDTSNVIFDRDRVTLYQKNAPPEIRARMSYIDYGLSILSREVIEQHVASGEKKDLAEIYQGFSFRGTN
jgi:NDP-sugar pyrophosphorylase family protein